ncbi:hypothetical protein AV530_009473 [Patagioenas fasciata monilis]|uniref:Uncharacterized protein n=1 Tax=Patagioenas fasciata monilis TaxID=372326 RepID=A0A1V4JZ25_PATFA|nr:hypothetical protein AV530_009473 [Patagioenas fasciata monilis]
MEKIEEYITKQPKAAEVLGPVEAAPEYRVIVDANNLTVEIENELRDWGVNLGVNWGDFGLNLGDFGSPTIIHKFIPDQYSYWGELG